jgi:hypothetical protein
MEPSCQVWFLWASTPHSGIMQSRAPVDASQGHSALSEHPLAYLATRRALSGLCKHVATVSPLGQVSIKCIFLFVLL